VGHWVGSLATANFDPATDPDYAFLRKRFDSYGLNDLDPLDVDPDDPDWQALLKKIEPEPPAMNTSAIERPPEEPEIDEGWVPDKYDPYFIEPAVRGALKGLASRTPFVGRGILSPVDEAPAPTYSNMATELTGEVAQGFAEGALLAPLGPAGIAAAGSVGYLGQDAKSRRIQAIRSGEADPGFLQTAGETLTDPKALAVAAVAGAAGYGAAKVSIGIQDKFASKVEQILGEGMEKITPAAVQMIAKNMGIDVGAGAAVTAADAIRRGEVPSLQELAIDTLVNAAPSAAFGVMGARGTVQNAEAKVLGAEVAAEANDSMVMGGDYSLTAGLSGAEGQIVQPGQMDAPTLPIGTDVGEGPMVNVVTAPPEGTPPPKKPKAGLSLKRFQEQLAEVRGPEEAAAAAEIVSARAGAMGLTPDEYVAQTFQKQAIRKGTEADKAEIAAKTSTDAMAQEAPASDVKEGYYSHLGRVVEGKMGGRMKSEEMRRMLKANGVKDEEIAETGLSSLLDENETLTKDQVRDHLAENEVQVEVVKRSDQPLTPDEAESAQITTELTEARQEAYRRSRRANQIESNLAEQGLDARDSTDWMVEVANRNRAQERVRYLESKSASMVRPKSPTRHSQWQTPGGENYQELLIRLPDSQAKGRNFVNQGHFDEPNILAHVRLNERVVDGKKTLFVEEIQSDWHQTGRTRGYKGNPDTSGWTAKEGEGDPASGPIWEVRNAQGRWIVGIPREGGRTAEQAIRRAADSERGPDGSRVPDAPFKKTWHELAFKKVADYAAKNGFEKIAWTSGKMQNERYSLSKQVDEIEWDSKGGRLYGIRDENPIFEKDGVTESNLADYVGKEVAERLLAQEPDGRGARMLSGEQLEVGGSGMKGFYDQILPTSVNKYVKKWGGKVGTAAIDPPPKDVLGRDQTVEAIEGYYQRGLITATERTNRIKEIQGMGQQVHSLDITPAMRDSILREGQPLFQDKNADIKAAVQWDKTGKAVITAFEKADFSSIVHELGHIFRRDIADPADVKIMEQFAGVKDGKWTRANEEVVARAFERYITTGKAPTQALAAVFRKMREWMRQVYRIVKGSDIDVKIPKDMRGVFDRMLGGGKDGDALAQTGKRVQTDTPEFKRWFGESKVVDKKGNPRRVYHGTPDGEIRQFRTEDGAFFTSKPDLAEQYTNKRGVWLSPGDAPAIIPAYLSMQNPLIIDAGGARHNNIPVPWKPWKPTTWGNLPKDAVSVNDAYRYAVENGHDGLIVKNVIDTAYHGDRTKSDVYAVVRPEQIKSAIGNSGAFDPANPNTLAQTATARPKPGLKRSKQPEPDLSEAQQRLRAKISSEKPKVREGRFLTIMERIDANIFSKGTAIKKMVDIVNAQLKKDGKRPLDPKQDPDILRRLLAGHMGALDLALNGFAGKGGVMDFNTKEFKTRAFDDIMKGLPKNDPDAPNKLRELMLAVDNIQSYGLGEVMTGTGDQAQILADSQDVYAQHFDGDLDTFSPKSDVGKVLKELMEWNDAVLQYAVDSEFLSAKTAAKFREKRKRHVSMRRVLEESELAGDSWQQKTGLTGRKVYQKRSGESERTILDPIESMVENARVVLEKADHNNVLLQMANLAKGHPQAMSGWMDKVPMVKKQRADGTWKTIPDPKFKNYVTVIRKGKQERWVVDPDIRRAIDGMNPKVLTEFQRLMAIPAQLLRAGQVLTPGFITSNGMFRDPVTQAIITRSGITFPGIGLARALFGVASYYTGKGAGKIGVLGEENIFTKAGDKLFMNSLRDLKKFGGSHAVEMNYYRDERRRSEFLRSNRKPGLARRAAGAVADWVESPYSPVGMLQRAAAFSEQVTRAQEEQMAYKRALKDGLDPVSAKMKASAESRGLMDFNEIGFLTQWARPYAAFFGSALQGEKRGLVALKEAPLRTLGKGLTFITLPSIINVLMNQDDDEYLTANTSQRDMNWFFRGPNGKGYWIPKPHGLLGWMFSVPFERHLLDTLKNDPKAWDDSFDQVWKSVPNPFPTWSRFLGELALNKSMFLDRPIVPKEFEDYPRAEQYDKETSLFARGVASGIEKVKPDRFEKLPLYLDSPFAIDYILYSLTGGVGKIVNKGVINHVFKDAVRKEGEPGPYAVEVFGRFQSKPQHFGGEVLNRFYDKLDRLEQMKNSEDHTGEVVSEFDPIELRQMNKALREMAEIREEIKALDGVEDLKEIEALRRELIDIAADFVELPEGALGRNPAPSQRRAVPGLR
jgi:hypothetical protein